MVEAEFHAVWKSPEGKLVEVTPKPHREVRILFVPDPRRTCQGLAIDNVRKPLRDDQMIRHFIRLAELKTDVLNRGVRALENGHVIVPVHEIEPLLQIQKFLGEHYWPSSAITAPARTAVVASTSAVTAGSSNPCPASKFRA